MSEREQGIVKWFDAKKGYGFIFKEDDGSEVFVHFKSIRHEGFRTLRDGQKVEFTIKQDDKGLKAEEVIILV